MGAGLLVDCPHALAFDYRVKVFRQLVRDDRARAGYGPQAGGVDASADADLDELDPSRTCTFAAGRCWRTRRRRSYPGAGGAGRLAVRYRNAAGLGWHRRRRLFKELLADVCASGLDPNRGVCLRVERG